MQVARSRAREERTLSAKLRQIARALEIERDVGKQGVSTLSHARALRRQLEGVRAASLAYFGKEPCAHVGEAALLVALPQSPEARRPDSLPKRRATRAPGARSRRPRGVINGETTRRRSEPIPTSAQDFPDARRPCRGRGCRRRPPGQVIRLTIDARLQAKLEALAKASVEKLGPKLSAAIVVIDNKSGEIRARIGAADYLDATRGGSIDMSRAPRSPGSALKPFIYALAFEQGLAHPETLLFDRPARYGAYPPENFDQGFPGTVTARKALQQSLNLPAVELWPMSARKISWPDCIAPAPTSRCRRTRRSASPSGSAVSAFRSSTSRGSTPASRAAARRRN